MTMIIYKVLLYYTNIICANVYDRYRFKKKTYQQCRVKAYALAGGTANVCAFN